MNNLAAKILVGQLEKSHKVFLETLEGVSEKVAHFQPEGTANPIAGTWAHAVLTEDGAINSMIRQIAPLFEAEWKGKTGVSTLQPSDWVNEYPKWLRSVRITLPKFMDYTRAVFADSEAYLKTLTDDDLERMVKTPWEAEGRPLYDMLNTFVISHLSNITGEIAVLKGIQGLKGYPF